MEQAFAHIPFTERRSKQRIHCDYPAMIKDEETQGKYFSQQGRVQNLSAGGIFVVTSQSLPDNAQVRVKIALPTGSLVWGSSALATRGVVVRSEAQSDGSIGIAIQFQKYKFV